MLPRIILALALLAPAAGALAEQSQVQRGRASFYHPENFTGRPMANGDRFDPQSNAAASRTLPLGTVADVTNLRNGETRRVVIEDRGPYAGGRILDVSPRTAEELGMVEAGVAPVEIRPVGRLPDKARDGQSGTE
ncbi:septal ring lytic transglycosylase RlpA family protein [Falsiroseomonas sp.]|uniref:septal ring lytic transglycosylase RlpA family protein n=1 Tax=Falsiroseomonas sp. TaxID=2870721 RepID=UPI00356B089C